MSATLRKQSHLVFGAGLIGCYLGGVLCTRGLVVNLVCRPRVKAKLEQGMLLTDYLGHKQTLDNVDLFSADSTKFYKFIWLSVKCTGIKQALVDVAEFVSTDTVILCCQNGLGSDALVKQAFPHNLVLRVMVPFNVVELNVGHFHRGSQGQLAIESTDVSQNGNQQISQTLVDLLNCDLLPVTHCKNMTALLWAKLQLNLGNSVNALADIPVKAMLEQRAYRLVIATLMKELLLLTDKLGLTLPKVTSLPAHWLPAVLALPNFVFKRVANRMLAIDPTVRTSMWWDVSQGKSTEIDYLNGAIVEHAQRLDIACPANIKMVQLIKSLSDEMKNERLPPLQPPIAAITLLTLLQNFINDKNE
jgi:2-dehydropantoate 2-reductase